MKQWLRITLRMAGLSMVLLVVALLALPWMGRQLNSYRTDGEIVAPGLAAPVEVVRDEKGMAYLRAESLDDALFVQGFLTAQDRLFQMHLLRLFSQGRLTELSGEDARTLDIENRTYGFHRLARRHTQALGEPSRRGLERYAAGVNAYLETMRDEIPLEFRLAGLKPEAWEAEDSVSILYFMAWKNGANLRHEMVAQMLVERLGWDRTQEILPLNINPDAPEPASAEEESPPATSDASVSETERSSRAEPSPSVNLGLADKIDRIAWLLDSGPLRFGSNNWAAAGERTESGLPILAGDPHLDARILPGVWYPLAMIWPDNRAVGVSVPGIPGMLIGRTQYIAMSPTNAYGDSQDLFIETLDPEDPERYLEGEESKALRIETETLKIKDDAAPGGFREEKVDLRFTERGPLVSSVLPNLKTDRVLSLRWAPAEFVDSSIGLMEPLAARSAGDLDRGFAGLSVVALNYVFADVEGNIGWRVTGRLPKRAERAGKMPWLVTGGEDPWQGWIPYDEMPHAMNPSRGWLGTANHMTIGPDYPYYFSNYFASSYRYRRLIELLDDEPTKKLTTDQFWAGQRDTKNLMAESLAPILAAALRDCGDDTLAAYLEDWDFHDRPDLVAPTIFQETYRQFAHEVFADELGEELAQAMLASWYFWQERLEQMVLEGTSTFFDDERTESIETRNDLICRAANLAKTRLGEIKGPDPGDWTWGSLHHLTFSNPIRRIGLGAAWLGSGPHPMGGSTETLYRGWYDFDEPFGATHTASLRMVVDLADREKIRAVLPGGVAGRTFHPHQKDQIHAFMSGEVLHWWFSDEAIEEHATHRMTLLP